MLLQERVSPQQVVRAGEALQQQTQHVADGGDGGLRQRGVPQRQQQLGDQLELPQQLGVFGRLTVPHRKTHFKQLLLSKREFKKWIRAWILSAAR